jgi:predicted nicotinamide N-methyase
MATISVQIPDDAVVGDTLSFIVDGQTLEIEVPPGSQPGDVMEIQVGGGGGVASSSSDAYEEDAEMGESSQSNSSVRLSSGEILHIFTSLPTPSTDGEANYCNTSHEGVLCDGTHAMAWPAGLALVKYIGSPDFAGWIDEERTYRSSNDHYSTQSVLELGSGIGIVGLAFSHFMSQRSSGIAAQVVLSDLPDAIPLLEYHIQQNQHLVSNKNLVHISTVPLLWHSLPISSTTSRLDWILGSDLLYNHKSIPALVATVQRLLSTKTTSRILLSVRWRKPDLEREFFARMSSSVDWILLDGTCRLSWENYGNPNCNDSNVFFSQTLVSVQGVPTSLAEIDESANQRMTSQEFEAWERVQIQIYVGKPKGQQSCSCGVKRTKASF